VIRINVFTHGKNDYIDFLEKNDPEKFVVLAMRRNKAFESYVFFEIDAEPEYLLLLKMKYGDINAWKR